jgi:4-carboxymuconolactone decarboxylase
VLGDRGLVEIIGLCGYYALVSMTLNAYEFELPEGEISDLAE